MTEHHILHSEGFEKATANLSHIIQDFKESTIRFEESVFRLRTIEAMKARNQLDVIMGQSPTYDESSFHGV